MANEIVGLWDIIVDGVECLLDRDKCKEEAEAKAIRAANRGCIVHLGLPGHVSLGSLVLAKSAGVSASADVSYKLASALMSGPILCTVAQFVVAASAHLGIQRTLATTTKQEVLRSHIELFGAHLIRVERAIAEYTPSRFGEVEDSYPVHHYYVGWTNRKPTRRKGPVRLRVELSSRRNLCHQGIGTTLNRSSNPRWEVSAGLVYQGVSAGGTASSNQEHDPVQHRPLAPGAGEVGRAINGGRVGARNVTVHGWC